MNGSTVIAILMATYNGAEYLAEQIASLQAQTRRDWKLYICDDGSSDGTPALLQHLTGEEPRIVVIDDPVKNRGACGRFLWLLEQTRSDHQLFFFCDQDDVWYPEKIERMASVFEKAPAGEPLLVHCDLAIVDQDLNPIKGSYLTERNVNVKRSEVRQRSTEELAIYNTVTGCACALNKALADLALPLPEAETGAAKDALMMHDWWLALVASHRGRIVTMPDVLVAYRQHGSNVVGAGKIHDWNHLLDRFYAVDRLSRKASHERLGRLLTKEPLWRLQALQKKFGSCDHSVSLLARARRLDLFRFMLVYCLFRQPLTMTLLTSFDIVRKSGD